MKQARAVSEIEIEIGHHQQETPTDEARDRGNDHRPEPGRTAVSGLVALAFQGLHWH